MYIDLVGVTNYPADYADRLIKRDTLVDRYEAELEPYITGPTPTWHRTTLKMWIDACWPE